MVNLPGMTSSVLGTACSWDSEKIWTNSTASRGYGDILRTTPRKDLRRKVKGRVKVKGRAKEIHNAGDVRMGGPQNSFANALKKP